MKKEKFTMEDLYSKLQGCCYLTQDDKPVISQGSIKIVRSLLEQIRDEIKESMISDKYGVCSINEVFNKYLNEKGGK